MVHVAKQNENVFNVITIKYLVINTGVAMMQHTDSQETRPNIIVLPATENDSTDIWKWRNDEQTKQMSITTDDVNWETHGRWHSNHCSIQIIIGMWVF